MQHRSEDRDFSGYNAAQADRPVRPLAVAAVEVARRGTTGADPTAVELGCGRGIEAAFLAESGFAVHTIDADPSVTGIMGDLATALPITHTTRELEQITALPAADLILSCATLPFVRRTRFTALWERTRSALRPGGVLAVDLFGDRDDWASTDGTFLARGEVTELLVGLEVLDLAEEERDGRSFSGPKHWHTYRVLARRL